MPGGRQRYIGSVPWPPSCTSLRLASKIAWYSEVSGAFSPRAHWLTPLGSQRPAMSGYLAGSNSCAALAGADTREASTIALRNIQQRIASLLPSRLDRIDMECAHDRQRLRRDHETNQRACCVHLLRHRQDGEVRAAWLVEEAGRYADKVGARHADHDIGLLDADLDIAAREIVGDWAAGALAARAYCLGLQGCGQPELLDPFRDIQAAAAERIADRLGGNERR